jgi:2-methylcitrate dehydratase PrpD
MTRHITGFIHDLDLADVPPGVLAQARQCLLDLIGAAAAGTTTALSRIMRDHAARHLRGEESTTPLLFDGRMVSPPGAALANAATNRRDRRPRRPPAHQGTCRRGDPAGGGIGSG